MNTVSEIAKRLRVSVGLIYRLVERGELRSYRIGGAIRISEEQLQDYLEGDRSVPAVGYTHVKRIGG